jgi:rhodanese-related sulfurtransferase
VVNVYKKITVEELAKLNAPIIIDVRESYEYEIGHIPNALNIPLDEIIDNYEKFLKTDTKYYIYCETSLRSSRVCDLLYDLGYDVNLIIGGYKDWLVFNSK